MAPEVTISRDFPALMRRSGGRIRAAVTGLAVALAAMVFGFAVFATHALRGPQSSVDPADGIIVLTGGDHRILVGARLLETGRARRMLISGVNPQTSRDDVIRLSGLDAERFACCVDLGYAAQDTIGNAEEARTWVRGVAGRRLIVVTSGYHMTRSLVELAMAMPGVTFVPYPVVSDTMRRRAWWLQPGLARLLMVEYLKLLPVAARYTFARHIAPLARLDGVDVTATAHVR